METVVLELINFADLESPDPQVRLKTNQTIARNERNVYGYVTQATTKVLQALDVELGQESGAGNAGSLPVKG